MSVLAGLRAKDGYLFYVDDLTGGSRGNSGIIKINNTCGAMLLTRNGEQLTRLRGVMSRCVSENAGENDYLSGAMIDNMTGFLENEFKCELSYRYNPLTFLLLLIGTGMKHKNDFEYIYIRNRVSERIEEKGKREFITTIDRDPPVPAANIFFGDSGLIEYLAGSVACSGQSTEFTKLLACYSTAEMNRKDNNIGEKIELASLTPDSGFYRAGPGEIEDLLEKTGWLTSAVKKGLNGFLSEQSAKNG